jgi:hypothetical protein
MRCGPTLSPHLTAALCLCGLVGLLRAAPTPAGPPADDWLSNLQRRPPATAIWHTPALPNQKAFLQLQAESVAGKLKIRWHPPAEVIPLQAELVTSSDAPERLEVRDWRSRPLQARGGAWEAAVPIDNVDVPLVYYVRVQTASGWQQSPLRMAHPRSSGLEEPSRIFWPFLEGFEDNLQSWRLINAPADAPPLQTNAPPHNGKAALRVTQPAGKHSVTVGTTRVRGWQIEQQMATGVRVWLRVSEGVGTAQFTLFANAFATNQTVQTTTNLVRLTPRWQRVDLPFNTFPKIPRGEIDFFTLEFTGADRQEFWVDNLSLLGRWRLEME